jgi:hypothetical protein
VELLDAVGAWPVAAWLRQSAIGYPAVNAAHILSIALLAGPIIVLDLRMLGVFSRVPIASFAPPLAMVAGIGLAGAVLTGLLLFLVRPAAYAENPAFLLKLALVTLGTGHAVLVRRGRGWRALAAGGRISLPLKMSALLSLLIWPAAIFAGRWIGFLQ